MSVFAVRKTTILVDSPPRGTQVIAERYMARNSQKLEFKLNWTSDRSMTTQDRE